MRFITVRDLRGHPTEVWRKLDDDRDIVLTSNGKPKAIITAVTEDDLEEKLAVLRQARAMAALRDVRRRAAEAGLHKMTLREINAEVAAARKERRR